MRSRSVRNRRRDHRAAGDSRRRGGGSGRRRRSRSRSGRGGRRWSPRRDERNGGGGGYLRDRRAGGRRRRSDSWRPRAASGRAGKRGCGGRRGRASPSYSSGASESCSGSSEEKDLKDASAGDSNKDEIIHFNWRQGMLLNSRYEIDSKLGDGTFGRVLLAHDRPNDRQVAIKVIRDVKRYMENAKIEASILKDVRRADPQGVSRCAVMYDTFVHCGKFFCLVFEPLGISLYDFLKRNGFRGFWMQDVQSFARQSLKALKFLHDSLQLTHTDLKPENVLLQCTETRESWFPREAQRKDSGSSKRELGQYLRPASSQIKIIDFGNATFAHEHHSSVINTRQYRGPEVLLELGWDERSDNWSMGCILMELYTGELLFGTHENLEHLALMEKIVAPLPQKSLLGASDSVKGKYLASKGSSNSYRLRWPEGASSRESERHVRGQHQLRDKAHTRAHKPFVDFVANLLICDKHLRPSAGEALKSDFFQEQFQD